MANGRIGSHASHGYRVVETLDTTGKQFSSSDSGKVFMVDLDGSHPTDKLNVHLPKLSNAVGWQSKFIIRTASASNDLNIIAYGSDVGGSTSGDSDKLICLEEGDTNAIATDADLINFASGQMAAGEYCTVMSDGSNWYSSVMVAGDSVAGGTG